MKTFLSLVSFFIFLLPVAGKPNMTLDNIKIEICKLSGRVYVCHADNGQYNIPIFVSRKGLVVVDSTNYPLIAEKVKKKISEKLHRNDYIYLINTHHHHDHTCGNQVFSEATIIAHSHTLNDMKKFNSKFQSFVDSRKRMYQKRGDKKSLLLVEDMEKNFTLTLPDKTFDTKMTLDLEDLTIILYHVGKDGAKPSLYHHTRSDIFVYVPEEKVLCTGDVYYKKEWLHTFPQENDLEKFNGFFKYCIKNGYKINTVIFGHDPIISKEKKFPVLKGPYLGQKPPGMTPEIFAPFILSRKQPDWAFSTAFTPNGKEFYFSQFNPVKKIDQIMYMKMTDGIWTKPVVAAFNKSFSNNDVRISPDGDRLLFRSMRPLPGHAVPEKHHYIWYVIRDGIRWSQPQPLECGGSYLRTGDLGIANNGSIYFAYKKDDRRGIFRSQLTNDTYSIPEFICSKSDTGNCEGDTFVAPDESYIIITCWDIPENSGESDLYISFRKKDNSWTPLTNMGIPVNTKNNENCATLSPDGKYFFYLGVNGGSSPPSCATYWISSKIIDNLKPVE